MTSKTALYSNCILVKGASRSVICDLQLQQLHYIPNSLYELLNEHLGKTIKEIKKSYGNKYDEVIDSYFQFLEEKECIFYTDFPEQFPPLNLEWDYPHKVSNAIIDYNYESKFDIVNILNQLGNLRCKNIQIRFFSSIKEEYIRLILEHLKQKQSIITSVEIYLKDSDWTNKENIIDTIFKFPRVSQCVIHSSDLNDIMSIGNKHLVYTHQNINSEVHCGKISPQYFSINLKTFTESKSFNSCLNRKITVDKNGNIKNCPSMFLSYGNINETSLEDVINDSDFKKIWSINKDQIDICKDCEFRYVCTDCRAYVDNSKDKYSKPLKCGYNPYTTKWEKWSGNPLKKDSIEYYGLTELI